MYKRINTIIYMNDSSLMAKTSFPCTIKKATAIVIIIGISTNLCRIPKIRAKEHNTSANTVSHKDRVLPNPNGSA